MQHIQLNIKQWNRLFPFFFLLNEAMQIIAIGDSLKKLRNFELGGNFSEYFLENRSGLSKLGFEVLKLSMDKIFFFEIETKKGKLVLRGQFEFLEEEQQLIFVGSPWFTKLEEVAEQEILLNDFAKHDASINLLHAKKMAEEDNIALLEQISKERNEFKHFAIIAEETLNAGILLDKVGKIQWVNRAFQQMNGYPIIACIGNSINSLLTGSETNPQTLQFIESKLKENSFFECEILNYQQNGNSYWAKVNGQPILNENGEVLHYFIVQEDITDRKRIEDQVRINEKRYRDLFNYSQALICTHDQNGVLQSVNPSICETLGYTAEELIGRPLMSFIPERENNNFRAYYLDIVMKEGKSKGVFRALHKNGKKLFLLYQNYLVEEAGAESYVIGFSQDITDRIHAENELLLANQITGNVSKAKEIFLANMSHEIRTPMNGILGVANLLAKTEMGDIQKNYLKLIKESANSLLVIVNDVLDIEKITSGKFEFEHIPFRFTDKFNSSMQSFQYKAEEKGIQLNYFSQLEEPLVLIGDPYRLIQILNNLLNNAIKFTARGKVIVNIFSSLRETDNIVVDFTVQDTGIGIDASKIETIFEPFVQASSDTTRKFGGTGLGLSICKNLIEMQGGSISVESKYGEGTVFHFNLPYKIGSTAMLAQEDVALEDYSLLGEKSVLIAEDVELNQFITRQILESWGMEVAVAENGKIALEMVQKQHFDLILMDIQMPEMDGIEATERIRKLDNTSLANIPIIALTANALKGDNHLYFQAGMNDYIIKPFTEGKLYAVMSKFLTANHSYLTPDVELDKQTPQILVKENPSLALNQVLDDLLYDLTMVKQIGKGNPDFIGKMVTLFLDQMPYDIIKLKQQADKDDWEALSKLAHRMKPSIEGMGIYSLKTIIRELESKSRNNETICDTEMKQLVAITCETMEKVLVQLRIEFLK